MPDDANGHTSHAGRRYGALEVIELAPRLTPRTRSARWRCRCDCGAIVVLSVARLTATRPPGSCGCRLHLMIDLAGQRFGMLVARKRVDVGDGRQGTRWRCDCDCGRSTVCRTKDLRSEGNTTSCGCRINRTVVTRGEVSPRQRAMLEAIAAAGGELPQKGLEAVVGTSPANVSYNATRLERRQLVRRVRRRPRKGESWLALVLTQAGRLFLRRGAAVPAEARAA